MWSFREESRAQRKLDDAKALAELQVEQAGMLGHSAMDAAGVQGGGMATRMASGSRRAGVPIAPQRPDPYFAVDNWTPVRCASYE